MSETIPEGELGDLVRFAAIVIPYSGMKNSRRSDIVVFKATVC
jgi:hypothetical protein